MIFRIVLVIFIAVASDIQNKVSGEDVLQIELPVSLKEEEILILHGYQIEGPKSLVLKELEEEFRLVCKIPLLNQEGNQCFALEKIKLSKKNLKYPLKIKDTAIKQFKELAKSEKRILDEDPSPSEIAISHDYHYLLHSTRPENLLSILTTAELNPSRGKLHRLRGDPFGNNQFVFCTLLKGKAQRENFLRLTGNTLPILVFKVDDILDCTQWHANIGHPLGMFSNLKTTDRKLFYSSHHTDRKRFKKFLKQTETEFCNEVVFHHPLQLERLECIYVKKGDKERIINELNDPRWVNLIVEVEPLLSEGIELPNWLTPYSANSYDKLCHALSNPKITFSDFQCLVQSEYPILTPVCEKFQSNGKEDRVAWFYSLLKETEHKLEL